MSTTVAPETTSGSGYQPPPGSLEAAQQRLVGLLSDPEDRTPPKTHPEQPAKTEASASAATPTEQAPAAPDTEKTQTESERATSTEAATPDASPSTQAAVAPSEPAAEQSTEEAQKERLRFADYTRKTQQVAEQRRALAEKEAAVEAARQRYESNLERMEQAIKEVTPEQPNWDVRRFQVTPEVLAQEMLDWNKNQERLAAIRGEKERVLQEKIAAAQQDMARHLEQEEQKLHAALPEFGDPATGPAVRTALYSYAKGLGFNDDQIASATTSHQVVVLLHKAMQWDKAQANKPKVENKITQALATPAPGNRTPAQPKSKLAEAKSRLKESGRVEDAAAAFYHLLPD